MTAMVPDWPLQVAVMVTLPAATPVTTPELETVASLVFEDIHVAWLVTSFVEWSL